MSSIIQVHDKRSGNTYFYESESYWDKEKQQPRSKRRLIGKLDPVTGKMVPTDGRGRKRGKKDKVSPSKPGPVPIKNINRRFYGATYLLDQIGETTGIAADLKACFPDDYKKILSIAYFLIIEDTDALIRFNHFDRTHRHPFGKDIPSQRSSELFQSITEEAKEKFFGLQGKRRIEKEYWAYDTTSISSYSETLRQVKYGKNKDNDRLPQINLALLFGEKSGLPFYYRKLAGNIPDVKTMRQLLKELDVLGFGKIKLCTDRGFYSADNINGLYKNHYKFIAGASTSLSYAKRFIRELGDDIQSFSNYSEEYHVYCATKTIAWDYTQERPYKGDTITGDRRMYLHLYYDSEKATEDEERQMAQLLKLKDELMNSHQKPEHENQYHKYFTIHETPVRGKKIEVNEEAIRKARQLYGYFVLLSNEVKDPIKALELYRTRDVVEKAFGNLKDRLNCKRMLTSSDLALEGKLFVEFVSLIYLSYIKAKMQENDLFKTYTMRSLLDELDVIECFEVPGNALAVGEVLKKQEELYKSLGVEPLPAKA